ncbi:TolC family protein [Desulfovibrio sp. OttesenSCG-928-C14]|nr:TolC family protein [Desulfovibrio sp. OttesenSCG-928-C14]
MFFSRKFTLASVLLALFLLTSGTAFGASMSKGGEVPLTILDALNVALKHNEDIQESYGRVSAAEAGAMSAQGVYDATVFGNGRYGRWDSLQPDMWDFASDSTKTYGRLDVGIRQRIPTGATATVYFTHSDERRLSYPGKKTRQYKDYVTFELTQSLLRGIGDKEQRGAIESALLSVQDSEESRSLIISQVMLDLIRAYWNVEYCDNNIQVAKKSLSMAQEVLRRENVRFKQGLSQGVDVDRARVAVKQRQYSILQYERDLALAREQLMLLLNHPDFTSRTNIKTVSAPMSQVIELPDPEESMRAAVNNRHELKQMDILLKQLDIELDINTNKLLPTLDLSAGVTTSNGNDFVRSAENFKDTDEDWSWYVGVSVSFPLQNREARGAVKRTEQLLRIAKERVHKTIRVVETDVRDALHALYLAREGLPVVKSAYNSAVQTMNGEMKRFEMLQANNRDLLASQDSVAREEMSYYRALIDYNVALAAYHHSCGTLLDKYAVVIGPHKAMLR